MRARRGFSAGPNIRRPAVDVELIARVRAAQPIQAYYNEAPRTNLQHVNRSWWSSSGTPNLPLKTAVEDGLNEGLLVDGEVSWTTNTTRVCLKYIQGI